MSIPITYSWRSIVIRKGSAAMAVFGIALVVVVFAVLLALAEGFRRAVASSGDPRNLIVLRKGADAELQSQVRREAARILADLPVVARAPGGETRFSVESLTLFNRTKRDGGMSQLNVRGVPPAGRLVHEEVRIASGRWFTPGSMEVVVGTALARRIADFEVGQRLVTGRLEFTIVGIFEAGGNAWESEVWLDGDVFTNAFNREDIYQSIVFRAAGDVDAVLRQLERLFDADPRLRSLQVQREDRYYAKQAELMASVITILGSFLTVIMGVGAVVGAMNTMYAAVAQRRREIGCLMAMGFRPEQVWAAFILEAMALAALGALLGCLISLCFDGIRTGTTNWATFSETAFEFSITPRILLLASGVALLLGFAGGLLPALQASRMKVVEALRRA